MNLSVLSTRELQVELAKRGLARVLPADKQGRWPHKVWEYKLYCPTCQTTNWGSLICPCGAYRELPQ